MPKKEQVQLKTVMEVPKIEKKYTFHVYKGNFPEFIVDALLKRGVWKKFDASVIGKRKSSHFLSSKTKGPVTVA